MTVHVGPYEFDQVSYDNDGDVLYLRLIETNADDLAESLAAA
jgi:hypothetical protein